jgi:hypothetical protein
MGVSDKLDRSGPSRYHYAEQQDYLFKRVSRQTSNHKTWSYQMLKTVDRQAMSWALDIGLMKLSRVPPGCIQTASAFEPLWVWWSSALIRTDWSAPSSWTDPGPRGEAPREMTLIGKAARERDICERRLVTVEQDLRALDALPDEPLVWRLTNGAPESPAELRSG